MIRLYIYKILYNSYSINFFYDEKNINMYQLDNYKDFNDFIKILQLNNIYQIDDKIKTIKGQYYDEIFQIIQKYKENEFNNIQIEKLIDINKIGIDNFYIASYNYTIANLHKQNLDMNLNFFRNICQPLFEKGSLLLKAIELFYNPNVYSKIKEQFNNTSNINYILHGYRYCLNELSFKNIKGIYYPLYDTNTSRKYLKEKLYPGNYPDSNMVYSEIINHFKSKPEEACYICLCNNPYYHSIKLGFPGNNELNMKCPNCSRNIGCYIDGKKLNIVKRNDYFRIFKDEKEIEIIKSHKDKRSKLGEINYMTLKQFKDSFISKLNKEEKGFHSLDLNLFKNDNKIIRNLSQISYRLLNYILFSHLFFAQIILNRTDFDKYLPKNTKWNDIIYICWNILRNELLKININSIEDFMNYIFVDIFQILNNEESIDNHEELVKFEDKFEKEIQKLIKNYKEEKLKSIKCENVEEINSFVNLLKEKFNSSYYKEDEFPFYKYFYYTDYLDEQYLYEKFKYMDENKYPVLKMYLDYINNKNQSEYSLDALYIFNSALNLLNKKYYNKITKAEAKKRILKYEEIYIENKKLFDDFIEYYNSFGKAYLSNDNPLCDFFIDDNNKFGKTYITLYKKFIKEQNEKFERIFNIKFKEGILGINYTNRINIQEIEEKEILTFKLSRSSFLKLIYNSSYRKILDDSSYRAYNEYIINYSLIEENLTDLLLKHIKLLNEDINEFKYYCKEFDNEVSDTINKFRKKYICRNMYLEDKVNIYKFCLDKKNNVYLYKQIINDFIELINFLNDQRNEDYYNSEDNKDNKINEKTKIYEILDKLKEIISKYFIKLFENNDFFTIDKIPDIFEYFLKCIYKDVSHYLENYGERLDDNYIKIIDKYYENHYGITKEDFAYAIRHFITLILFREDDIENILQNNYNNIINYLQSPDYWKTEVYENKNFIENLKELKQMNIPINQVFSLYEFLGGDIDKYFFNDVENIIFKYIIKEKEESSYESDETEHVTNSDNDD